MASNAKKKRINFDMLFENQDSFFLANADVFQGWPQLFSSPNVLKVNVSLPEEKPLLRGMVKVDFILCFSLLPF